MVTIPRLGLKMTLPDAYGCYASRPHSARAQLPCGERIPPRLYCLSHPAGNQDWTRLRDYPAEKTIPDDRTSQPPESSRLAAERMHGQSELRRSRVAGPFLDASDSMPLQRRARPGLLVVGTIGILPEQHSNEEMTVLSYCWRSRRSRPTKRLARPGELVLNSSASAIAPLGHPPTRRSDREVPTQGNRPV